MYRAPVIMGKNDRSSKYAKLILKKLGFSKAEIYGLMAR